MSKPRPQLAVFIGILLGQIALTAILSLQEEPLLVLAMATSCVGSALMLWDEARTPRRSCVDAAVERS